MSKGPERFFQSELKGEEPPRCATMQALYDLAAELFACHPWTLLADEELVLVERASAEETCFCSIMGALGQVFSLHVYLGPDGYRLFKRLQSGKPITVGEFLSTGRCLSVEFVPLRELTSPDRALLKAEGHPLKPRTRAPIFRSFRPGYHPWYVTEGEARVLAECARAMIAFCDLFLRNPDVDYWEKEDVYPLLVPRTENRKDGEYQVHSVRAPLLPLAMPEPPALDDAHIQRVRDAGFPSEGILEVDHFYGAGMVGKKNERKACVRMALAINAETASPTRPWWFSPKPPPETLSRVWFFRRSRLRGPCRDACQKPRVQSSAGASRTRVGNLRESQHVPPGARLCQEPPVGNDGRSRRVPSPLKDRSRRQKSLSFLSIASPISFPPAIPPRACRHAF